MVAPRSISADRPVRGVLAELRALLDRRLTYVRRDGDSFFDATQNARVVRAAEHYYRLMYRSAKESWNLRDRHMFDTLVRCSPRVAAMRKPSSGRIFACRQCRGDCYGLARRVQHRESCRAAFGESAVLIGFGTDRGTVAARVIGMGPWK